jgi:hypothetical protein
MQMMTNRWGVSIYLSIVLVKHYLASMLVPIQVNHEDEEQDLASDEEELLLDQGQFHNNGFFDFGNAVITTATHQGVFFQRRQRGNSLLTFL